MGIFKNPLKGSKKTSISTSPDTAILAAKASEAIALPPTETPRVKFITELPPEPKSNAHYQGGTDAGGKQVRYQGSVNPDSAFRHERSNGGPGNGYGPPEGLTQGYAGFDDRSGALEPVMGKPVEMIAEYEDLSRVGLRQEPASDGAYFDRDYQERRQPSGRIHSQEPYRDGAFMPDPSAVDFVRTTSKTRESIPVAETSFERELQRQASERSQELYDRDPRSREQDVIRALSPITEVSVKDAESRRADDFLRARDERVQRPNCRAPQPPAVDRGSDLRAGMVDAGLIAENSAMMLTQSPMLYAHSPKLQAHNNVRESDGYHQEVEHRPSRPAAATDTFSPGPRKTSISTPDTDETQINPTEDPRKPLAIPKKPPKPHISRLQVPPSSALTSAESGELPIADAYLQATVALVFERLDDLKTQIFDQLRTVERGNDVRLVIIKLRKVNDCMGCSWYNEGLKAVADWWLKMCAQGDHIGLYANVAKQVMRKECECEERTSLSRCLRCQLFNQSIRDAAGLLEAREGAYNTTLCLIASMMEAFWTGHSVPGAYDVLYASEAPSLESLKQFESLVKAIRLELKNSRLYELDPHGGEKVNGFVVVPSVRSKTRKSSRNDRPPPERKEGRGTSEYKSRSPREPRDETKRSSRDYESRQSKEYDRQDGNGYASRDSRRSQYEDSRESKSRYHTEQRSSKSSSTAYKSWDKDDIQKFVSSQRTSTKTRASESPRR